MEISDGRQRISPLQIGGPAGFGGGLSPEEAGPKMPQFTRQEKPAITSRHGQSTVGFGLIGEGGAAQTEVGRYGISLKGVASHTAQQQPYSQSEHPFHRASP